MTISLVVAMSENGVIGREGGLPWRLSTDLKRFKAITMGKPVVMGRKTWDSIGRPLPGRLNIVISRDATFSAPGVTTAGSLEEALTLGRAEAGPEGEICVIGGGEIFRETLPLADILYVTHVAADVEGDVYFPGIDAVHWRAISQENVAAGEKDMYPTRYVVYERQRPRKATDSGTA